MDQMQFSAIYKRLIAKYGEHMEDKSNEYWIELRSFSEKDFDTAVTVWIDNNKYYPEPKNLTKLCKTNAPTKVLVSCSICEPMAGQIMIEKIGANYNSAIVACQCEAGKSFSDRILRENDVPVGKQRRNNYWIKKLGPEPEIELSKEGQEIMERIKTRKNNHVNDEEAMEMTEKIITAITHIGWSSPEMAKKQLGSVAWQAVEQCGGWLEICRYENIETVRVHLLDACKCEKLLKIK